MFQPNNFAEMLALSAEHRAERAEERAEQAAKWAANAERRADWGLYSSVAMNLVAASGVAVAIVAIVVK